MTATERIVVAYFIPHALLKLRVGIPWQVRYIRWWWKRDAEYEVLGGRLDSAGRSLQYARVAVAWWRRTGAVPITMMREAEALDLMRHPPRVAAQHLFNQVRR